MRAREFIVKEQRTDEFIQALAPAAMAIGRGAMAAGSTLARGAQAVGSAVSKGAQALGGAVSKGAQAVGQGVQKVGQAAQVAGAAGQQDQQQDPAQIQKDKQTISANLSGLKSAGLNIDTQKAMTALGKSDAGQPLNPTDQKTMSPITDKLANILVDPKLSGQLKNIIAQTPQQ